MIKSRYLHKYAIPKQPSSIIGEYCDVMELAAKPGEKDLMDILEDLDSLDLCLPDEEEEQKAQRTNPYKRTIGKYTIN